MIESWWAFVKNDIYDLLYAACTYDDRNKIESSEECLIKFMLLRLVIRWWHANSCLIKKVNYFIHIIQFFLSLTVILHELRWYLSQSALANVELWSLLQQLLSCKQNHQHYWLMIEFKSWSKMNFCYFKRRYLHSLMHWFCPNWVLSFNALNSWIILDSFLITMIMIVINCKLLHLLSYLYIKRLVMWQAKLV